jgi:hypothetical protein
MERREEGPYRRKDFSTLKIEAIRSSETSVYFTGSTRRHIPEDGILHSHRCENLKSCIHTPSSNWLITIAIKWRAKCKFDTNAILLLYVI